MSKTIELAAEIRQDMGKGASRRLRRKGLVPGVIYGIHQPPQNLQLEQRQLLKSLQNEAIYSQIITLNLANEKQPVILKALHRHPYKPMVLHFDLQRISATEKITMHIPIHYLNANLAPGVKDLGGIVIHHLAELEISCLPKDLPQAFEVDLSHMNMHDTIHLSDLKPQPGVTLVALAHGDDRAIVTIEAVKENVVEEGAPQAPVTLTAVIPDDVLAAQNTAEKEKKEKKK
jgi:large subunit ribosomal protein L25